MLSTHGDGSPAIALKDNAYPSRGKRYSKAQKEKILEYAKVHNVVAAAVKFNVTAAQFMNGAVL